MKPNLRAWKFAPIDSHALAEFVFRRQPYTTPLSEQNIERAIRCYLDNVSPTLRLDLPPSPHSQLTALQWLNESINEGSVISVDPPLPAEHTVAPDLEFADRVASTFGVAEKL